MARRLRIQYEGALYHVINRGNYCWDIFETKGAAQAFLATLGQACERHDFRVHAYMIMRNHYHLALETPRANLVEGMHWLQSTFASRFNRFRDAHGHLFQGRYQAPLIENAASLVRVVNYIHVNPVAAKIVAASDIATFAWSSLSAFVKGTRPAWLNCASVLTQLGLTDTSQSWADYVASLITLANDPAEQERQGFSELEHGWAIGTSAWRAALARDYAHLALAPGIPAAELRHIKESRWLDALQRELANSGKNADDISRDQKGAHWKIAIAGQLRRTVAAPYRWITVQLNMGTPEAVRVNVARFS